MVNDPQLDQLPLDAVVDLLLDAEARVLPALRRAAPELVKAARVLHEVIAGGGRLLFTGAGTSGRLAAAEAAELPGTFGIEAARCATHIAGADSALIDDTAEDDAESGARGIEAARLGAGDVVIAVAASGRTPFTVAAADAALGAGAAVIAVVTTAATPLAARATAAIEVVVGDEVLRGSTRLTAGTVQKIALNTLTTAAMAHAGRVHGNLMVDMVAANVKLRDRAAAIVARIAGCPDSDARAALTACDGNARAAVLHLVTGIDVPAAVERAAAHRSLRAALDG
jgi:N-acetylmuramic acid 6-phosphate etherase